MMNEIEILENLDKCENRIQLESLWTKIYIQYRNEAWKLWNHFEEKRGEVAHAKQAYSEAYKANGWD